MTAWKDHLIACGVVVIVTQVLRLASTVANATTVALVLLLIVLFVARSLTGGAAITASVAGVLAFNFFFLPPTNTFTIADPLNWVALVAFLAVALTVGELSARTKRESARVEAHRAEAERLYKELQAAFDREAETEAGRRSERLKSALLDAVTHNLRTRIFDKFYRAPSTQALAGGTGLGLAIVRGIIDAHRGDVAVKNRPGKSGAAFMVRIPIADDEGG